MENAKRIYAINLKAESHHGRSLSVVERRLRARRTSKPDRPRPTLSAFPARVVLGCTSQSTCKT